MNIQTIINYLDELNNENIELKLKLSKIEKENEELKNNLNNFTKVSFIGNMDKQLNDKIKQNELLEKQLSTANRIINNYNKLSEKKEIDIPTEYIYIPTEKVDIPTENIYIPTEKVDIPTEKVDIPTETEKVKISIEKTESKKESKKKTNYELIQYKKINYYLDLETNTVYDIKNDKINKHIANFINNKLKFI